MRHLSTTVLISLWLLVGDSLVGGALPLRLAPISSAHKSYSAQQVRPITSFDADWRFLKGDQHGAELLAFDDSSWRHLNVPHDWSIEGPFDERNPAGGAGAFLPAGVGWYRKHFTLPASYCQRHVFIEFDGVMANSDVWINGQHLGRRPCGYVSFSYELTGHLEFGADKTNVLAVRADNSAQPASRWYSGAGIYRHVRLVVTSPIHIEQWGTFVTTPKVAARQATVHISSRVVNQSDSPAEVTLGFMVLGPDSDAVATAKTGAQTVPVGKSMDFSQDIPVSNPELWDTGHPVLYRAVARVLVGNVTTDDEETYFGIREFHFDAATGFWLNGKNFKLQGVCLHHDGGALGAAVPLAAWERRLVLLKQIGVNSIRTAHNPPAPEFLDLCDRLGLLVMDEMFDCWTVAKNAYDYHLYFNDWAKVDARDTVRRDRNHPCIVLYSAGNEIRDTPNAQLARGILAGLVDVFHKFDPTRPVTQALFRPNVSHDYDDGLADLLDVIGTNYRDDELIAAHRAKPERRIVGTEQGHDLRTWLACRDNPSHAGQFIWTGMDYLGESRRWPVVAAGSGLLDRTGNLKPIAYERESWWSEKPVVHIVRRVEAAQATAADPGFEPLTRRQSQLADWTPKDATAHDENVEAYSNCDEVEITLNGRSLGSRPRNSDASPRKWSVLYEPGVIRAIGRNKGQIVATDELRTAGKPAKVVLVADKTRLAPEWDDVSYVSAAVVDRDGVLVPDASPLISFRVSGPGAIVAVDSADNASHEPFQATERHAFHGRSVAIVRARAASGRITIAASALGLSSASTTIDTVPSVESNR
jgi:beta-galactosidase